jgi:OOP family OmpA-OmpF porin
MNKHSQARTSLAIRAIRATPLATLCLAALLAAGCASYTITPEMQARAAAENPAPPKDADFPALDSAKWQQGAFPSIEALRAMHTGMGKDQVRELLGYPHFSEGLGGVREWNYIFHFRTGAGPAYITCQYMVRYNADVLTNGMYWKGPGCADLLKPAPAADETRRGHSVLAREDDDARCRRALSLRRPLARRPAARRPAQARCAGQRYQGQRATGGSVRVTGHTDRLGSASYNQALSLARAETVRGYLVQAGVPRERVQVQGRGESEPKVQCAQTSRAALIDCLAPNRRVGDRGVGRALTPAAAGRPRVPVRYAPPLRASATTCASCATWSSCSTASRSSFLRPAARRCTSTWRRSMLLGLRLTSPASSQRDTSATTPCGCACSRSAISLTVAHSRPAKPCV